MYIIHILYIYVYTCIYMCVITYVLQIAEIDLHHSMASMAALIKYLGVRIEH